MAPVPTSSARPTVIQGSFLGGRPRISAIALPLAPIQPRVAQRQAGPASTGAPKISPLAQPRGVHPQAFQPRTATPQGPVVQRVGNGEAFQLPANLPGFGGAGGQPLPDPVRQKMESFFGASFADVRVHVGSQAHSIGALAFTHGSNLYFAPGQYNPNTTQGRQLLGHELTHVVQQRAGRVRNPFGSGIAVVQDRGMEAEAERMGQRAAAHQPTVQRKSAALPEPRATPGVAQRVLDIKSSPKSPIYELKYRDFTALKKRFNLPIATWLCLKDMAASEPTTPFNDWKEAISLVNNVLVESTTINAGAVFYKGGGLNFKIEQKSDWSGCYLTDTLGLASGYGNVITLRATAPLPVVRVTGEFIGLGKIPSLVKANLIKNLLNIPLARKLVPYLGSQGKGYVGLENEEGEYETIVPWTILKEHFDWDGKE